MNTEAEIRRLRWEADALERQMKSDRLISMGFKSWENPDLKNGDSIITVHKDFSYGFISSINIKELTFYDMSWWIRPEELKPGELESIRRKMKYPSKGYLEEYLKSNK